MIKKSDQSKTIPYLIESNRVIFRFQYQNEQKLLQILIFNMINNAIFKEAFDYTKFTNEQRFLFDSVQRFYLHLRYIDKKNFQLIEKENSVSFQIKLTILNQQKIISFTINRVIAQAKKSDQNIAVAQSLQIKNKELNQSLSALDINMKIVSTMAKSSMKDLISLTNGQSIRNLDLDYIHEPIKRKPIVISSVQSDEKQQREQRMKRIKEILLKPVEFLSFEPMKNYNKKVFSIKQNIVTVISCQNKQEHIISKIPYNKFKSSFGIRILNSTNKDICFGFVSENSRQCQKIKAKQDTITLNLNGDKNLFINEKHVIDEALQQLKNQQVFYMTIDHMNRKIIWQTQLQFISIQRDLPQKFRDKNLYPFLVMSDKDDAVQLIMEREIYLS